MATKREILAAAIASLEKWKKNEFDFRTGKWSLDAGRWSCALCVLFGNTAWSPKRSLCMKCPLGKTGKPCYQVRSAFGKTYRTADKDHLLSALRDAVALAAVDVMIEECEGILRGNKS